MTPSQLGQSCADNEGLEEALEVNERNHIRPLKKQGVVGWSRWQQIILMIDQLDDRAQPELKEILKNYTMNTGVGRTTLRFTSCVVVRTKSENAGNNPDKKGQAIVSSHEGTSC